MRGVWIAIVLLTIGAGAKAGEPAALPRALDGIAWLVGGQWNSTARLPSGMRIQARLVAEWGPGRLSMRLRTWMKKGDGEAQTYESLLYWHRRKERVEYLTFGPGGRTYRGTGKIDHRRLVLTQEASGGFPALRQVYEPDPEKKDRYRGSSSFQKDGRWTEVMSAVSTRGEIRPFGRAAAKETSPSDRLGPLAKMAGGEWRLAGGEEEARVSVAGSLGGALLLAWTSQPAGGKPASLRVSWRDAPSGAVRFLEVRRDADPVEGRWSFLDDGARWVREWTVVPPEGEAIAHREEYAWKSADRAEVRALRREGGEWKERSSSVISRRR
jgi:hypothetical protein